MAKDPPEHDGLPVEIRDVWHSGDIAATVEWLLSGPVDDRWPDTATCNGIAVACVEILLSADPGVARTLLATLVPRAAPGLGRIHLLEQRIDAAARIDDLADVNATYEHLAAALEELADPHLSIRVLNNAATHLKDARAYDAAERILIGLLASPGIEPGTRVAVLINLATVLGEVALTGRKGGSRDIAPALLALNEAYELAASLDDSRLLAGVWFNRGFLYGRTGRSAEAVRAYDEAAVAYEAAGGDHFDLAYVRRGQAAEAARNGRLDDAVNHFRVAADLFMKAGQLDEAARTHVGLLMAMTSSGHPPGRSETEDLLEVVRLTRPAEVPDLLMNIGNIVGIEEPGGALDLYRQAAALFAAQDKQRDVCRAMHSEAAMVRRLGDPSQALGIMDDVKSRYVDWGLGKEVAEVDYNRALVLTDLERYDEALVAALAALGELDRHRHTLAGPADRAGIYSHTYPHLFDVALDLARRAADNDLVAALAERSRVQVNPAEQPVPGSEQFARPPQVSARELSRPVAGTIPGVDLVGIAADLLGPGTAWLSWASHRGQLLRILVTPGETFVSAVPWPTDLLLDLRDAIADPTDADHAATKDEAAAGRVALYRAATGPLLNDPDLAARLGPTLDPGGATEWVGRASSRASFLTELSSALLPPVLVDYLHAPRETSNVGTLRSDDHAQEGEPPKTGLVLAPPVELGRIPWAALPVGNRALVEGASVVLAPPLGTLLRTPPGSSLNTRPHPAAARASDNTLWVIDTRGDLPHCRATLPGAALVLSAGTSPRATRETLLDALAHSRFEALVVRSHVGAGTAGDPLSAAILLSGETELTARDLLKAGVTVPKRCIILGCDAAGAATGSEWAGLPLGLSSAGASVLVMTLWPVVDDSIQQALDLDLLSMTLSDPARGLTTWQQLQARQWREGAAGSAQPYRWANLGLVATSRAPVNV